MRVRFDPPCCCTPSPAGGVASAQPHAIVRITARDSTGAVIPAAELTVTRGLHDVIARGTTDAAATPSCRVELKDTERPPGHDAQDWLLARRSLLRGQPAGTPPTSRSPSRRPMTDLAAGDGSSRSATPSARAITSTPTTSRHDDARADNAWELVKRLRPDMLTSRGGCETGVQEVWVNGKRIRLPLRPTGMAAARARVGVPPGLAFSYVPVRVLSDIAPEHILEINYHDCFDTSMAAVGSVNAMFIVAQAGRRLPAGRRQLRGLDDDGARLAEVGDAPRSGRDDGIPLAPIIHRRRSRPPRSRRRRGSTAAVRGIHIRPREQPQTPAFALDELTIDELQKRMRDGAETAHSLAQQYLARIDAIDQRGPAINSVIELNPDALAIAAQLDAERKRRQAARPAARHSGADQGQHRYGRPDAHHRRIARARRQHRGARFVRRRAAARGRRGDPRQDESQRVGELSFDAIRRAAGADVADRRAIRTRSIATPSGSSSGPARRPPPNCCAVAIGTETDGSVTSPAAAAALVGIKPTVGLISRRGIIPIAHSQDTAGPMARTVRDAAILLGALTGVDPRDPATRASAGHSLRRLHARRSTRTGCAARASASRGSVTPDITRETDTLFEQALDLMKQHGAIIVDPADIATAGETDDSEFDRAAVRVQGRSQRVSRRSRRTSPVQSLADVIAFNTKNAARELRYFGQEIMRAGAEEGAAHREEVSRRRWRRIGG